MKPVVFASEAKEEFDAAATFYEMQRAGLGDAFVDEVERAVRRIAKMPQAYAIHTTSCTRKSDFHSICIFSN